MIAQELVYAAADSLNIARSSISETGDPGLADFLGWVNDGLAEVQRRGQWAWLRARATLTTTAGVETLSLPTDFSAFLADDLQAYYSTAAYTLCYRTPEEISALRASGTQTAGQPVWWCDHFDSATLRHQMSFWPRPESALSIVVPYRRRIPKLTSMADTVAVPPEMDTVCRLAAMCWADESHAKVPASVHRGKFEAALEAAWAEHGSIIKGAVMRMRPVLGDRGPSRLVDPVMVVEQAAQG